MKKIQYLLIKMYMIYTVGELAKLLGVHKDTVRTWIKKGLPIVNGSKCPILIRGRDAKQFLQQMSKDRKCPLKDNEFFCVKCRKACSANPSNITIEISDECLSEGNRKAVIYGKCRCGRQVQRFGSERIVKKWINEGWVYKENVTQRFSGDTPTVNTDTQMVLFSTHKAGDNVV